ncbi:MAG: hypothetical protein ACK47B_21795 [Armatimonadota bacterium]
MAAATKDREAKRQDGTLKAEPMAVAKVFKGTLVNHNAAGYAAPAGANANETFAGVAYEAADNTGGAVGDKKVRVEKVGEYEFVAAGIVQADVGKEVYVTDDQTVQIAAPANAIKCGVISEYVSATRVRIRIDNYAR